MNLRPSKPVPHQQRGQREPGSGEGECVISAYRAETAAEAHPTSCDHPCDTAWKWIFAGYTLSVRQREIIRHVVAGRGNKDIARRMGIGTNTVRTHLARLIQKFCLGDSFSAARETLVRWAFQRYRMAIRNGATQFGCPQRDDG